MGKSITVNIPHRLTVEEAKARINRGIADARQQFAGQIAQLNEQWTGDRLDFNVTAMGQTLSGSVDVRPDVVVVSLDLPWILAILANKIRPELEGRATKLLA